MSAKIQITGLELALIDWGIDQALGKKIGDQLISVINPLAQSLATGGNVEQALLTVAIAEAGNVTTSNATVQALLPVIVEIATAVEGGATIEQALQAVLSGLLTPPATTGLGVTTNGPTT